MGHSEENIPIYVSRTINSYKGTLMKTESHHYDHVHMCIAIAMHKI